MLLLLVACRTHPLEVRVVAPIPHESLSKTECYLEDLPEPPEQPTIDFNNEDVIDRAFVHMREYSAMVTYAHDMVTAVNLIDLCLRKLVETNANLIEIRRVP